MAEDKHSHAKGFIAGAVLGTLVGGIAALLLAPTSGKETQDELKERAKKVVRQTDGRLSEIEDELEDHIDNLKEVARDLRGAAYEDSQRLITRAEMLKNDLQDSANRLATTGRDAKQNATNDAKRLVTEGQAVLGELEQMTKKLIASDRPSSGRAPGSDDTKK